MKRNFLIVVCLMVVTVASGQSFFKQFKKVIAENDLSDPCINCMAIDGLGFLWLGTQNGLSRYNGIAFKNYLYNLDKPTIPDNFINSIITISNNRLLISTNNGLCIYNLNTSQFSTYYQSTKSAKKNVFSYTFYDGINTIYTQLNNKLYRLDTTLKGMQIVEIFDPKGKKKSNTVGKVEKILTIKNEVVALLYQGNENWQYYILRENDLIPLTGNSGYLKFLSHITLQSDVIVNKEYLYIRKLSTDSIFYFNVNNGLFGASKIENLSSQQFYYNCYFLALSDSLLFCNASTGGFIAFNKPTFNYDNINGRVKGESYLRYNMINCALSDSFGNVWLGTRLGLCKTELNANNFQTKNFTEKQSLTGQQGLNETICFTKNGIYITTSGNGVYYRSFPEIGGKWNNIVWSKAQNASNDVWNVRQHKKDLLWIGTQKGMQWLNEKTGKKGSLSFGKPYRTMDSVPITTQFVDSDSLLWIGLGKGTGVSVYDLKLEKITKYLHSGSLGTMPIRHVLYVSEDCFNNIWLADSHSKKIMSWIRKQDKFIVYDSLAYFFPQLISINSLVADKMGNLWISSNIGLLQYQIQQKKIKKIPLDNDFSNYNVVSCEVDNTEKIWFSTYRGLYYFFSGKLYQPIENKFFKDSLITNIKFSYSSKKLYLITPFTINSFDTEPTKVPLIPFRIFIDSLTYLENEVEFIDGIIVVPHHYKQFTIQFSALNLIDAAATTYYYSINGQNFISLANQRQLSLISLTSGTYFVKIKAKDRNGVWSINEIALTIKVGYPFWQKWWFIITILLCVVGSVYFFYQYRVNQIIQLQEIRNGIARNLHDDIGSSITNISILTKLITNHLYDFTKTTSFLKRIEEEAINSAESLDDIVWSINNNSNSLNAILTRMRRYAHEIFESGKIMIHLNISEINPDKKINIEQVHDIYLLFKEYLSNVIKHSNADNLTIFVFKRKSDLVLLFEDDGVGFDVQQTFKGNGLNNINKRTKVWKGNVSIQSTKGNGTVCEILIPLRFS